MVYMWTRRGTRYNQMIFFTSGCQYDGGDCCASYINTEKCVNCECKVCYHPSWIGDGFCDDATNTPGW